MLLALVEIISSRNRAFGRRTTTRISLSVVKTTQTIVLVVKYIMRIPAVVVIGDPCVRVVTRWVSIMTEGSTLGVLLGLIVICAQRMC